MLPLSFFFLVKYLEKAICTSLPSRLWSAFCPHSLLPLFLPKSQTSDTTTHTLCLQSTNLASQFHFSWCFHHCRCSFSVFPPLTPISPSSLKCISSPVCPQSSFLQTLSALITTATHCLALLYHCFTASLPLLYCRGCLTHLPVFSFFSNPLSTLSQGGGISPPLELTLPLFHSILCLSFPPKYPLGIHFCLSKISFCVSPEFPET